jgi:hypothetical protein
MSNDTSNSGVRLTGFAAACLWHRRLVRAHALRYARAKPRISAELVLRPVPRDHLRAASSGAARVDASRHVA